MFKTFVVVAMLVMSFSVYSASFEVAKDGEVGAYFLGGSAGNTTYLSSIIDDVVRFEGFNNKTTPIGKYVSFDDHLAGDSVEFVLYNHTSGYNFYSNMVNNGDGLNHIKYTEVTLSNGTAAVFVRFEDMYNLGDGDYNDSMALFTNVQLVPEVPEPETYVMLLLGLGLIYASASSKRTAD